MEQYLNKDFIFRHKFSLIGIVVLLFALPLILFLVKQKQETRTQAAKSTTLTFLPSTTQSEPLNKNLGEEFTFDLMVNPGTNLVSLAKIEVLYDHTKMTLSPTNPLVVNSIAFPEIIEGPVYTTGKVQIVISTGSDQTRVIQEPTKALTLKFKGTSVISTSVSFGPNNMLYSIAPNDSSNEDVLSTTTPAYVKINNAPAPSPTPTSNPTPTLSPSPSPTTPSPTPTKAPTPTPTTIPTPTPTGAKTILNLNGVKLHGIGKGGDSPNPSSIGNMNPLHTTRDLTLEIYSTSEVLLNTLSGTVAYASATGDFSGSIEVPSTVASGNYLIKIKSPQYLRRQLPGFLTLTKDQSNNLSQATLIAGDINGDNSLSNLDYNIIIGCYSDILPARDCDVTRKAKADLSDDGKVDQNDYNLFMRELSVQQGE